MKATLGTIEAMIEYHQEQIAHLRHYRELVTDEPLPAVHGDPPPTTRAEIVRRLRALQAAHLEWLALKPGTRRGHERA